MVKSQVKAGAGVIGIVKNNKPAATIVIADNPTKSAPNADWNFRAIRIFRHG